MKEEMDQPLSFKFNPRKYRGICGEKRRRKARRFTNPNTEKYKDCGGYGTCLISLIKNFDAIF